MGIPVMIGYFACAIALGITASKAGISPIQATLVSLLLNASAGEYAFFQTVLTGGTYIEMAVLEFVANARYLLMSCAIGQKTSEEVKLHERLIIGFDLTDELFGASIAREEKLTFAFYLGMMTVSIPGWAFGTLAGTLLGNVLPTVAVIALGMGLYGMFLSTVIPAARRSKVLFFAVVLSMSCSLAFSLLPVIRELSEGFRTIILTVGLSTLFALLFPIRDKENGEGGDNA
ncbi:MAG: AzlC family ABC transporter permease [Clostridia bacterium]|nr:AzlC family ABC transporter permease [Clostridia bacterium]